MPFKKIFAPSNAKFNEKKVFQMPIASEKVAVVGIDFGTSRSGFSFIDTQDKDKKIHYKLKWEGANHRYPKTVTQLVYREGKHVEKWGYEAEQFISELQTEELEEYVLLKYFKMQLKYSQSGMFSPKEKPNVTFNVIEVIADYLRLLYESVMESLEEKFGRRLQNDEVRWCLTIPAIWEDSQKQAMKKAAFKAGMIETVEVSEDDFVLVLEPEAAAAYCFSEQLALQGQSFNNGDTILIVDAGGGTVDITSHKVENSRLRELVSGSGGDCGSSKLDEAYLQFLKEKLGNELQDFFDENRSDYYQILMNWEEAKVKINSLDVASFVNFPNSVVEDYGITFPTGMKIPSRQQIKLKSEDVKNIFQPTFSAILNLVEQHINEVESQTNHSIDYIFVVGGLGCSKALQKMIHDKYDEKVRKVITSDNAGEAIVHGAALLGLDDNIIESRISRYSYGIRVALEFDSTKHEASKKYYSVERSRYEANDCFDIFVKKGQEVKVDEYIEKTYFPSTSNQTSCEIALYKSIFTDVVHVTDHRVGQVGSLNIDMSDLAGGLNRTLEVKMYFGKSEIKVSVVEGNSGKVYHASIDFQK